MRGAIDSQILIRILARQANSSTNGKVIVQADVDPLSQQSDIKKYNSQGGMAINKGAQKSADGQCWH